MKKKSLIIIICVLTIIILFIAFAYYKIFIDSNKKENKNIKYKNNVEYVYLCKKNSSNETYYSLSKDGDCIKKNFSCKNCDIDFHTYENIIIYYTNNKTINLYDMNKNKIVDSFDVYVGEGGDIEGWVNFYTQDTKLYGFTYYVNDSPEKKFYNLSLLKTIGNIDGNICIPSNDDSINLCDLSNQENKDLIKNDLAIIAKRINTNSNYKSDYKYGLINLKTGKMLIDVTKDFLTIMNDYYISDRDTNNKMGFNIYDKDGNILFNNTEGNKLYYGDLITGTNNGYFIVFNDDNYVYVIDKNGNILNNAKISQVDINNKIYAKISNANVKDKFNDDIGVFYSTYKDNTFVYFDEDDNSIYLQFSYSDSYYETYVALIYKYNLSTNKIEIVPENYSELH